MASLDDILARLAPQEVAPLHLHWEMDHGGAWFEVTAWASPGVKLGDDRLQVPFRRTVPKTGDAEADVRQAVENIEAEVRASLAPPAAAKRSRGRPRKAA